MVSERELKSIIKRTENTLHFSKQGAFDEELEACETQEEYASVELNEEQLIDAQQTAEKNLVESEAWHNAEVQIVEEIEISHLVFLYTKVPVVDCDFVPFAVVRVGGSQSFPAETLENKFHGKYKVQYRWFRQCWKYECSVPTCFRPATFQFSPKLLGSSNGDEPEIDYEDSSESCFSFCSKQCLEEFWQQLKSRLSHISNRNSVYNRNCCDKRLQTKEIYDRFLLEDTVVLANQIEYKPVGWLRKYIPTLEDLGHCLRLQCYCERISDEGLVISDTSKCIDSKPVIKPNRDRSQRTFRSYPDDKPVSLEESRKQNTFRVLSYNCLAEIYTSESLYAHCPDWALSWTYRRHNLLREIFTYDADIMCLQEIQADHYEAHLKPAFVRRGYEGVYKVKSREAMGQRGKMDGCATLWKRDLFQLREQFAIDFNSAACVRYFSNPLALNRLMKGNIALVTILDFLDGSGSLCIVNIHVYWDPEQTDVKLFQVNVLMEELEAYLSQIEPYTPLIIGGDFNSTPDSTIYELMSTGTVSGEREDIQRDPLGLIAQMRLRHELNLQSAYSVRGNEPKYTNYTDNFVGVLDYIWYTPSQLAVAALLEVPSEADIVSPSEPSLPNHFWSSDHIALMTEFRRII
ncbi:hypothetical protein GpartN1_g1366.t1 [Galdieria partita]|uniref:Endonuclease/exonuclease/phosphatase domain-containing protein n=1 Tax=Galdieria partita TaxID=83374 RepID=A0A9C7PS82_9RHOD|nr:hypothetical protein GpartN1_g1366.t1 [Galdieria partita]